MGGSESDNRRVTEAIVEAEVFVTILVSWPNGTRFGAQHFDSSSEKTGQDLEMCIDGHLRIPCDDETSMNILFEQGIPVGVNRVASDFSRILNTVVGERFRSVSELARRENGIIEFVRNAQLSGY